MKKFSEFQAEYQEEVIYNLMGSASSVDEVIERAILRNLPALSAKATSIAETYRAAVRELQSLAEGSSVRPRDPCQTCDGLGEVTNGITTDGPCPDCGGTGSRSSHEAMKIRVERAKARDGGIGEMTGRVVRPDEMDALEGEDNDR